MNGHERSPTFSGHVTYQSLVIAIRHRHPLTKYPQWWPERSRVFVPGSLR